jgi:uncharacterized phage protein (TIGR02220 family)
MEIISFINDLRKMGAIYYKIWLPIMLQFNKEEPVIIKLIVPLDLPKSTYYRILYYGLTIFSKHVKSYTLIKKHGELILSKNQENDIKSYVEGVNSKNQETKIEPIQTLQAEIIEPTTIQPDEIVKKRIRQKGKDVKSSYPDEVYEEIISFLNQSTGKDYKTNPVSVTNKKFITQRLNDGYVVDEFKKVIAIKSTKWLNSKMETYLRPETLFSNRFESYLNENAVSDSKNSNLRNSYEQINKATELLNNQE